MLSLTQLRDCLGKMRFHLAFEAQIEWVGIVEVRCGLDHIERFRMIVRHRDLLPGQLQSIDLRDQAAQMLRIELHLLGDLRFRGMPPEPALQLRGRLGNLAASAPHIARTPVGFTQAVQDGSANSKLRKGFELHILRAVEAARGLDKPDDAGAHQVFHFHVLWKALADTRSNVIDLRQLLHDEIFSVACIRRTRSVSQLGRSHLVTS